MAYKQPAGSAEAAFVEGWDTTTKAGTVQQFPTIYDAAAAAVQDDKPSGAFGMNVPTVNHNTAASANPATSDKR